MSRLRAKMVAAAAAALAALLFTLPLASAQNTQTSPEVELSGIKLGSSFAYISNSKFNADRSGRPEDDYPGYPVSRPLPADASKGAPFMPRQNYSVTARVRNTGAKTIKFITWEITYFEDAGKTRKLGCHSSTLRGKVAPGETRSIRGYLSGTNLKPSPHSTTNILWVEYSDRTAWQKEGVARSVSSRPCGS